MRQARTESSATIEDRENHKGEMRKYIVLRLFEGDKYPLCLTVSRAKLIRKHIADIQHFADVYDDQRTTIGKALS